MALDDGWLALDFSDATAEIGDEFVDGRELGFGRLVAIEVTDKADSESDIVEVIAGDVATVDLPGPAIADFDFAIARGISITDDEVISEAVLHFPHSPVIDIKDPGIPLPGPAVVNNYVFPTAALDPRLIDGLADCRSEIAPAFEEAGECWTGRGFEALVLLESGFLDDNRRIERATAGRLALRSLGWRGWGGGGFRWLGRGTDRLRLLHRIWHFVWKGNEILGFFDRRLRR